MVCGSVILMFARFNALPLLGCLVIAAARLTLQYPACNVASGLNDAGLGARTAPLGSVAVGQVVAIKRN